MITIRVSQSYLSRTKIVTTKDVNEILGDVLGLTLQADNTYVFELCHDSELFVASHNWGDREKCTIKMNKNGRVTVVSTFGDKTEPLTINSTTMTQLLLNLGILEIVEVEKMKEHALALYYIYFT